MIMIDAWNLRADLSLEKRGLRFVNPETHVHTRIFRNMQKRLMRCINEYTKQRGWTKEELGFNKWANLLNVKNVSPAFNKPYDIPIIDDNSINTDDVPGMFGILVQSFYGGKYHETERFTLSEAVAQVRLHYSSIDVSKD